VDESHLSDENKDQMEGEDECEDFEGEHKDNGDIYLEVEEIHDHIDSESDMMSELLEQFKDVISKVRKVVKIFK
jgi:hypothetical protein